MINEHRIFICGDTHGLLDVPKLEYIASRQADSITKDDYLIIAGDSGIIWSDDDYNNQLRKIYDAFPWTTIVVPGNHENYDAIEQLPLVTFLNARMRKYTDSIYFVERGEIMNINGFTFWCFGGASSIDKAWRVEHESWWSQEMPTDAEYQHGFNTLQLHDDCVDFIITHEVSDYYVDILGHYRYEHNRLSNYLEGVREAAHYRHHFAGHYHTDITFDPYQTVLYNVVVEIKEDGSIVNVPLYKQGEDWE